MNQSPTHKELQTKVTMANTPFFSPVIQKKLSVGSANDTYEKEADHMADRVMRMPEPMPHYTTQTGALLQRKCAACEQEEKLQMKPLAAGITPLIQRSSTSESGGHAPSHIESQINGSKGGGSHMDHSTQQFMESRFGTDFSDVKIHTGSQAVQMSQELNAQAFTVGNDIYFNEGKYSPQSDSGKHLLAHELTHTVQQGGGIERKVQRSIRNPLFPCFETSLLAGGPAFAGTWIHIAIEQHYVRSIDPMAATEYVIPGSSLLGRSGRADIVDSRGGVYEIKPLGLISDGFAEATNYVAMAELHCDPTVNWHLGNRYIPTLISMGDYNVFTWLTGPGVIAYTYSRRVPVPIPVPYTAPERLREPRVDQDFMTRMAKLTGLTGAALIAYVIISEGTRIIPLRNAIPIP